VKNILQIVSLDRLLGIEQFKELLNESWSNIDFKALDINSLVNDQLKEELINSLEMWPGWIDFLLLLNTSLVVPEVGFLDVGQRSEDVSLNRVHDIIQVGHDQGSHNFLVLKVGLQLVDRIQSLSLSLHVLSLVGVVELLGAN
jgi:hypothetical protein